MDRNRSTEDEAAEIQCSIEGYRQRNERVLSEWRSVRGEPDLLHLLRRHRGVFGSVCSSFLVWFRENILTCSGPTARYSDESLQGGVWVSPDNPADFHRRRISHDSFEVQASWEGLLFPRLSKIPPWEALHVSQLRVVTE